MKNNLDHNIDENIEKKINWKELQSEFKAKLGTDIYESWLKKIDFVNEFKNYVLL